MRFVEQCVVEEYGESWREKMVIFRNIHMKFSGIKKMIIKINAIH